jgi:hypothetical protein
MLIQKSEGEGMAKRDKTVVVDADQYARLKPYLEANGVSLTEVNRAIKEDLDQPNAPTVPDWSSQQ